MLSLGVTTAVGLQRGSRLANDLTHDRLVTTNASRASDVTNYLNAIIDQVANLGASPGAADAIVRFDEAIDELDGIDPNSPEAEELADHYLTNVIPARERAGGTMIVVEQLLPALPEAIELQSLYTVPGAGDGDEDRAQRRCGRR